MEELDSIVSDTIDKYYKQLSITGYQDYNTVYRICILLCIQFILNTYPWLVTDNDLRYLTRALYCVAGDCLIDYPTIYSDKGLFNKIKSDLELRISESEVLRKTVGKSILRVRIK